LVVLVLCVAVQLSMAEDSKPMTKVGDKALLFTLGGLGNLSAGNYQGGLGFQYYFANKLALRAALGFTMSDVTVKDNVVPPATPGPDQKTSTMGFPIAVGIRYNLAQSNAVVAYTGGQVSFSTTSTTVDNPNHSTTTTKNKTTSTVFGVGVFFGVEWFAWNNISIGGEYQLGFSSTSGKTEVTTNGTTSSFDAPSTTNFNLGSVNAANLTVSVYF